MFSIETPTDFFRKVEKNLEALDRDIADAGLALNCVPSSYHLHEWVWARWLKDKAPCKLDGTIIRDKRDFVAWLEKNCPHFTVVQELANGTKHCRPVHSTKKIAGYGMGPYGIGPWGAPYLLVDLGDSLPNHERYLVASDVLRAVVAFWKKFFMENAVVSAPAVTEVGT
jgi:hypothetical protein